MRIGIASHNASRGDAQARYVRELAIWLAGAGHEVHLYAHACDSDLAEEYGCHVHRVSTVASPNLAKSLSFAAFAALEMGRRSHDIVHGNGTATLGATHVNTCHFCHSAWRALPLELRVPRQRRAPVQRLYYRSYTALHAYLERRCFAAAKTVLAASRQGAAELQHFAGVMGSRVKIVPLGLDPNEFRPAGPAERESLRHRLTFACGRLYVLFVGDLATRRKGAETLLAAAGHLNRADVTFLFAGRVDSRTDAPAGTENAHIKMLGYRRDVADLMRAADVFVLPTHYDSFGEVTLEAMASGLATICSTRAGSSDFISDGVNGLLYDLPGDAVCLASLLQRVVSDSGLRARLGGAARETAAARTWSTMAAEIEAVYRAVS